MVSTNHKAGFFGQGQPESTVNQLNFGAIKFRVLATLLKDMDMRRGSGGGGWALSKMEML